MSSKKVKRHPTIEDDVLIGTGTKILGDITIGARTKIGCNLVIKHDIPKDMVIFETDPENMYVRKLSRNATAAQAEEKKIPDNYIEYYI
jgi:serine O-acetyltransferase